MFKVIAVAPDEIRLDEQAVSAMLTRACRRRMPLWIEGLAADRERVLFVCTERPAGMGRPVYRLSRVETDLAAELRMRYDGGFRTVGVFRGEDDCWILTERMDDASADGDCRASE